MLPDHIQATPRQRDLLDAIADGRARTVQEAAALLGMSIGAARYYSTAVRQRYGLTWQQVMYVYGRQVERERIANERRAIKGFLREERQKRERAERALRKVLAQ